MIALISSVNRVDIAVFKWCMSRKYTPEIASISRFISWLGDGYIYVLIGIVLLVIDTKYSVHIFSTTLAAFSIELAGYFVFKNGIKRQRPADVIRGFDAFLVPSDRFSFPSGHTAAAFVMATMAAYYFPSLALFSFSLASLVGVSRVLLGVHFPSDILAGCVLGVGSAFTAISVLGVS